MRSLAFNVHAFRVAVDIRTGEVRILQSVQSADAGTVMNPEQCRGQVEGGVAQAIGTSLYEEVMIGADGAVANPVFRTYRVPQMADIPTTEVYFAEHQRRPRPVRGEVDEREPLQPGRARDRQRDPPGRRHPPLRDSVLPGPGMAHAPPGPPPPPGTASPTDALAAEHAGTADHSAGTAEAAEHDRTQHRDSVMSVGPIR